MVGDIVGNVAGQAQGEGEGTGFEQEAWRYSVLPMQMRDGESKADHCHEVGVQLVVAVLHLGEGIVVELDRAVDVGKLLSGDNVGRGKEKVEIL